MTKLKLIAPLIICLSINIACAQTDKEKAATKAKEAIKIEDTQGRYTEALALLIEAEVLDPGNYTYPFEQAYTYAKLKEYQKAADVLEKLLDHKDANGQTFAALANNYDFLNQRDKAMATYERGLKKFPKSGDLYVELGNVALMANDGNKAISNYEKGIAVDPVYAGNYYRAAKIFLTSSSEKVWGMVYGELFMNLERNSARTAEMSKLLYDTYKSQITFPDTNKIAVSFSKNMVLNPNELKDGKMPFSMLYEMALTTSVGGQKTVDLPMLNKARSNMLEQYLKMAAKAPDKGLLFDHQKALANAGHLEAYNYWILMQGDFEGFKTWRTANQDKWDAFIKWFGRNPIKITEQNKFVRVN